MDALVEMSKHLKNLEKTTVRVKAVGQYPGKRRTDVADVAVYQNDGTEKITPSKFVERAETEADKWDKETGLAISDAIDGSNSGLRALALRMADDISNMCDRIKTRRLKTSFQGEVKKQ